MTDVLERLEEELCAEIVNNSLPQDLWDPEELLRRWTFFSEQVPRVLGALLSCVRTPAAQCLLAKNIASECGEGEPSRMHSALLHDLIDSVVEPNSGGDSSNLRVQIDKAISRISGMNEAQAIGFLVGLEAPAYEILDVLRKCLRALGADESTISKSPYLVIHEEIEKTHQDDGRQMAQIVSRLGCDPNDLQNGGQEAVRFWQDWWVSS